MKDRQRGKVEQQFLYKLEYCKMSVTFDILNDIIDNVTLVQLMEVVVDINHAVIISGFFIFYSNY